MEHFNVIVDEGLRTGMADVTDPGASGTIEFENKGLIAICQVVTAAAESRTLESAANHPVGSRLFVMLKTDGGDLTIATADTPDTILTAAGQVAEFVVTDANGTKQWRKLSVLADGAALTAQLTTLTHTAPGTDDFAIQALTQTSPFGFVTADEGHTTLKVIANLQTRLAEVEARLEAAGIIGS